MKDEPAGDGALVKAREEREQAEPGLGVGRPPSTRRTLSLILFLVALAAGGLAVLHHMPDEASPAASSRTPMAPHPTPSPE